MPLGHPCQCCNKQTKRVPFVLRRLGSVTGCMVAHVMHDRLYLIDHWNRTVHDWTGDMIDCMLCVYREAPSRRNLSEVTAGRCDSCRRRRHRRCVIFGVHVRRFSTATNCMRRSLMDLPARLPTNHIPIYQTEVKQLQAESRLLKPILHLRRDDG